MAKRKLSYVWKDPKTGYYYGRIQVKQDNGKYKTEYTDRAINATHAEQLALELKEKYAKSGQAFFDGRKMTLFDLAEWYKPKYAIPALYVDGKKVAGMRGWKAERSKIDRICSTLGHHLIVELDEDILRDYKLSELKKGKKISSVNRDLESIRAMIRKAVKKKWRTENLDFDELIDKSLENRRTVTITLDEEQRILEKARDKNIVYAPRLYPLILALRDSGARPNELYPVNDSESDYSSQETFYEPIRWRDVFNDDMSVRDVTVFVSYKGKMREERIGIISERMKAAFVELWEYLKKSRRVTPPNAANLDNLIFPHTTYKKAWTVVRNAAELPGLRLRDLRRDWVTRLARKGYSDKLAQRGAGHKTLQMSYEYTEFDYAAAMQAKALIDADNVIETSSAIN